MSGTGATLAGTFGMTDFLVPLVLGDMPEVDARKRARGDSGPSVLWTVGHLLFYRCHVLGLLGVERDNPYGPLYGKAGATDGAEYPDVATLLGEWDEIAEQLRDALASDAWKETWYRCHGDAPREQISRFNNRSRPRRCLATCPPAASRDRSRLQIQHPGRCHRSSNSLRSRRSRRCR